jgi:hypothetical protein
MDSPLEIRIAAALEELADSWKTSLRAVEKKYCVSRRTLQHRQTGGISKQEARCSQQLLSAAQEKLLVSWTLTFEAEGNPPHTILYEKWLDKSHEFQAAQI